MPIPGGSLVLMNKKRTDVPKPKTKKKEKAPKDEKVEESRNTGSHSNLTSPSHQSSQGQACAGHASPSQQACAGHAHSGRLGSGHAYKPINQAGRSASGYQLSSGGQASLPQKSPSYQGLHLIAGLDQDPRSAGSSYYVSPKSSPKLPRLKVQSKAPSTHVRDHN